MFTVTEYSKSFIHRFWLHIFDLCGITKHRPWEQKIKGCFCFSHSFCAVQKYLYPLKIIHFVKLKLQSVSYLDFMRFYVTTITFFEAFHMKRLTFFDNFYNICRALHRVTLFVLRCFPHFFGLPSNQDGYRSRPFLSSLKETVTRRVFALCKISQSDSGLTGFTLQTVHLCCAWGGKTLEHKMFSLVICPVPPFYKIKKKVIHVI